MLNIACYVYIYIWQRHAIFANVPEHLLPLLDDFFIPVGRYKWESERGQVWEQRGSRSFLVSFLQTLELQQHWTIVHCYYHVESSHDSHENKMMTVMCWSLRLLTPDIEKQSSGPSLRMLDGDWSYCVESCHDEVSSVSLFQSAFTWENGMQAGNFKATFSVSAQDDRLITKGTRKFKEFPWISPKFEICPFLLPSVTLSIFG